MADSGRASSSHESPPMPSSASTRGTTLETRHRQDAACGGIGKRRLVRKTAEAWTQKAGKSRQPGGEAGREDSAEGGRCSSTSRGMLVDSSDRPLVLRCSSEYLGLP
jgi:hypothetical protein